MKPSDDFLENLAKDYVTQTYACIGSTTLIYKDGTDPYEDGYDGWYQLVDVTIWDSNVIKRDDKAKEYTIEVKASVVIKYGEDDETDEPATEERVIFCYIGHEGEYFVSDAEE